jgi:hypothetical protein
MRLFVVLVAICGALLVAIGTRAQQQPNQSWANLVYNANSESLPCPSTDYLSVATSALKTAKIACANLYPTVATIAGTSYTFAAADCWQTDHFTNAAAVTATVPAGLPTGCNLTLVQDGLGRVTVSFSGSGITPQSFDNCNGSAGRWAVFGVHIESAAAAEFYGRCS